MESRSTGKQRRGQHRTAALALVLLAGGTLLAGRAPAADAPAPPAIDWARAREHWAFRPPQAQRSPGVRRKDWPRQPLDAFILARLEQQGLAPSPEADPRALIRRVTYDLTGLPPTPSEVETFVRECDREGTLGVGRWASGTPSAERAPQAANGGGVSRAAQVPRRVFSRGAAPAASPLGKTEPARNPAGRRDPHSDAGARLTTAPGNTPTHPHTPTPTPPRENASSSTAYERLVDRLLASPRFGERLASMWLPLARYGEDQAHQVGSDTKFFYPNAHLYRQWVIDAFNRDLPYDRFVRLQVAADSVPGAEKADQAALGFLGLGPKYYNRNRLDVMSDEWQDRVDTVTRTFLGLTVACARCHDHKYDPVTTHDYYALAGVFASTKMVNKAPDGTVETTATEAAKMPKDTLHVVEDDAPRDLNVFVRGSVENKGPLVARRFLRVLSEGEPAPFQHGSGRLDLAEALTARSNPLTARVMVNRVWGLLFGTPLVSTPSNFGLIGDRPTHPELLDFLAAAFSGVPSSEFRVPGSAPANSGPGTRNSELSLGWSIKRLVREMVLSATYRQTSSGGARLGAGPVHSSHRFAQIEAKEARTGPAANGPSSGTVPNLRRSAKSVDNPGSSDGRDPQAVDPENRLLWRMNRRRLSVEQWRDGTLFVSGLLEPGGGPSQELTDPANHRRTVYARISRLKLNDLLMQFDYPDANVHAEKRSATTTPMQKLFLLNSPFMGEQARALAARLAADGSASDAERVGHAYLLLYGRAPSAEEARLGLEFLQRPEADGMPRWERYAQVLLAANEMWFLD